MHTNLLCNTKKSFAITSRLVSYRTADYLHSVVWLTYAQGELSAAADDTRPEHDQLTFKTHSNFSSTKPKKNHLLYVKLVP